MDSKTGATLCHIADGSIRPRARDQSPMSTLGVADSPRWLGLIGACGEGKNHNMQITPCLLPVTPCHLVVQNPSDQTLRTWWFGVLSFYPLKSVPPNAPSPAGNSVWYYKPGQKPLPGKWQGTLYFAWSLWLIFACACNFSVFLAIVCSMVRRPFIIFLPNYSCY